jgi:hypothetical protein
MPVTPATQEAEIRKLMIQHQSGQGGEGFTWSQYLPSKHEALNSNPNAAPIPKIKVYISADIF